MSSDVDDGVRSSPVEGTERTPRDHQTSGPPGPADLLPKGPPPPLPVGGRPLPRREPDDPREASDDSRPEQRWPVLADGCRLQGPLLDALRTRPDPGHAPGRDQAPMGRVDSSDSASGPDMPPIPAPRAEAPARAALAGDDAAEESGSWSETSLDLGGPALAQAIETLLGMCRNQLSRTALLSNRELGGRVGGLRRHLHLKQWSYVSQHARRILDSEDLEKWQAFEHGATHEFRPHRRPAADDD